MLTHEWFLCQDQRLSRSPSLVPDSFAPSRALRMRSSLGFSTQQGQWCGALLFSPSAPSAKSSSTDMLLHCPKRSCVIELWWAGATQDTHFSLVINNRHLTSYTGRGHPEQWLSTETRGEFHLFRSTVSGFVKFSCMPGFQFCIRSTRLGVYFLVGATQRKERCLLECNAL